LGSPLASPSLYHWPHSAHVLHQAVFLCCCSWGVEQLRPLDGCCLSDKQQQQQGCQAATAVQSAAVDPLQLQYLECRLAALPHRVAHHAVKVQSYKTMRSPACSNMLLVLQAVYVLQAGDRPAHLLQLGCLLLAYGDLLQRRGGPFVV
jgi:hypothetical protein